MRAVRTDPVLGPARGWGPADRVTLVRAVLSAAVAVLVAVSFGRPVPVPLLVALAATVLLLDAVDGWVARRSGTVSPFGARFDLEVDAFLILVLSVYVARSAGAWVLAIGAARYAFVAAGWLLPWLRGSVPPRYWCKVVAAVQGVVLTVAAADLLPVAWRDAALVLALTLLAESFGREVWQLWRRRDVHRVTAPPAWVRTAAAGLVTGTAGLLVWFALLAPDQLAGFTPAALLRIPLEGVVVLALVLVLPAVVARPLAVLVGGLLGVLGVVKLLDMAFFEVLARPFDPLTDWGYLDSGVSFLSDSVGRGAALTMLAGFVVLALAVLVGTPLAVRRLTRIAGRHRVGSVRTATALALGWVLCAVSGAQLVAGAPIASASAAELAYRHLSDVRTSWQDRQVFADAVAEDRFRDTPGDELLTALRGKDVLLVFVESYGRVALEDLDGSAHLRTVLDASTRRLGAAGFESRSAFLTSPTFGAASWLAHASLQSGLWVDSEQRYGDLLQTDRLTLSAAFERAGWRTVDVVPANTEDWPEGPAFYGFDRLYDSRTLGYAGPPFSYATMPDQYTLAALQRLELARPDRAPVMAEVDLVSSHNPWTPLPRMVGWGRVGDGSVFDGMPEDGLAPEQVFPDEEQVRAAYSRSVEYAIRSLVGFLRTYGDDDLVVVMLGDHQPPTIVSGSDADRDVPVSVVAGDPAVLDRISGWGWQAGLRPDPDATVWPMDAFRDRFLTAYGPHPGQDP